MHKYIKFKDGEKKVFMKPGTCKPDQPEAICPTLSQFRLFCTTLLHCSLNGSTKFTA